MSTLPDNLETTNALAEEFAPCADEPKQRRSLADEYIQLVESWREENVITITPENVRSISDIGSDIRLGPAAIFSDDVDDPYMEVPEGKNCTGARGETTEFADKVDAIYDKVSSLETTTFDALNTIAQINGQLDNTCRNSVATSRTVRAIDERVSKLSCEITGVNLRLETLSSEVRELKQLITAAYKTPVSDGILYYK